MVLTFAALLHGCGSGRVMNVSPRSEGISMEEKHRLYSAALAASDAPLDNDLFKTVCKEIGIFDAVGKPNDTYAGFVSEHVSWGTRVESEQFRQEIGSKQKAREYIAQHLP